MCRTGHTHHFGVSPVDDDTHAVRRGGHLTSRTWAGSRAGRGEARPGEGVQGEGVDIVVIYKVSERGGERREMSGNLVKKRAENWPQEDEPKRSSSSMKQFHT